MKLKILIACLLCFISINVVNAVEVPKVTDHEIVKVYVFWRDGCGYCESLIEALNEVEEEYLEYFEIVTIDVYGGSNGDLYDYISNLLGDSGYVPYTVVGSEHIAGFNLDGILEAAFSEYQNDEYEDILGAYASSVGDYDLEDLEYACDYKGIEYWNVSEKETDSSSYIVVGVFFVILAAILCLIFIPRKKA